MPVKNMRVQKRTVKQQDRKDQKQNVPIFADMIEIAFQPLPAKEQYRGASSRRQKCRDCRKNLCGQCETDRQGKKGGEPGQHQKPEHKPEPDAICEFMFCKYDL